MPRSAALALNHLICDCVCVCVRSCVHVCMCLRAWCCPGPSEPPATALLLWMPPAAWQHEHHKVLYINKAAAHLIVDRGHAAHQGIHVLIGALHQHGAKEAHEAAHILVILRRERRLWGTQTAATMQPPPRWRKHPASACARREASKQRSRAAARGSDHQITAPARARC